MLFTRRYKKGLESTFFLFRPRTKLPHPNTRYIGPGVGSWVLASELCESGQRRDVHICVSREGGVQNVSGYFVQAGTVAIGGRGQRVWYSWYGGHRGPGQRRSI